MKGTAFAPCHISGFFHPIYHPNVYQTGSRGAGININKGVLATVEMVESEKTKINISCDKKPLDSPVLTTAIQYLLPSETYQIYVTLSCDLPAGQGFGISGASALSTSIALCVLLKQPIEQAWMAAHRAEIEMKTGLGDVSAQIHGGVEIREKPGIPPFGKIVSLPGSWDIIVCTMDSTISTSDVLKNKKRMKQIIALGKQCTDMLLKNPSFHYLMTLSQDFTRKSDLASDLILHAMDAVKDIGIASMSMLGNTVFAVGNNEQLTSILSTFGTVQCCSVDLQGARFISTSD